MAEFDALVQAAHSEPVPTLVVHDSGDRQTPYADAVRLVEGLPDARLVTTDGLGHRKILRDERVLREVVAFVDGREVPGAAPREVYAVRWCTKHQRQSSSGSADSMTGCVESRGSGRVACCMGDESQQATLPQARHCRSATHR